MRALTVRQPFASAIAAGFKTTETRSWRTLYRGPLLIHAGCANHVAPNLRPSAANCRSALDARTGWRAGGSMPLGAMIAVTSVQGCVGTDEYLRAGGRGGDWDLGQANWGDFTPGRYVWLLSTPVALNEPMHCGGRRGLWNPDPQLVRAALRACHPAGRRAAQ